MQSTTFIRRAVTTLLVAVTVLMPVFFLPYTLEVLELNKHFLLYGLVLLALMLWLLEGAITRKFVIHRSAFDVPVVVYLGVIVLAGLFSLDRFLSFVGDYNNIQMSVLAVVFLIAYAFLVTQVFITDRSRLYLLASAAGGGVLAGIWFLLDKFKIVEFSDFSVIISNSTSMSNSEFGVYLVMLLLGSVALLSVKKKSFLIDGMAGFVGLLSLFILLSLGFKVVYIILGIGLAILLAFMLTYADYLRLPWITATFALIVLAVLFVFLKTPRLVDFDLPVEIALGVGSSYDVAWGAVTENTKQFLIGSGPATFVHDFSQFKPEALNANNFAWRIRFGKPYSTFVSMIAETGIVGALAFVFLVLIVLGYITGLWMRSLSEKARSAGAFNAKSSFVYLIAPVWITLFVAMFFVHISINLWLLFFMLLAMLSSTLMPSAKHDVVEISLKSSPQYLLATSFSVVLLFAGGIVFAIFSGRYYAAEVQYTDAQTTASSPAQQISMLTNATNLNKKSSRYRVALAQSYLNEARVIAGQADGSPDLIARLVAKAVDEARIATETSPRSVDTWETLANMYLNARSFTLQVIPFVSDSFEKAVALEPANPVLHLQLGQAKYAEGKTTEAKESFEEAIRLKGDYLDAYIQLSAYYEKENDLDRAITELERALQVGKQNDVFLFQLGRLYFNRANDGDWDLALTVFNAALAVNPNNANALFSAGVIFDRRGDREVALRYFEEVLKRDPGNESVATRVKQLRGILGIQ